ncbi:TPA: hypothetical protein HA265_01480 [Candidatus Woesearchaeota archaeon]|nr:hypothetical protein [Candidatus Woesearchaeota archaeon]
MGSKRAQAAMEFLMTYGWAILVVLAAIGALAYFGVLSPDRFLPEKCTLPSGVACLDFTGTASQVSLVIQNSAGFDMNNVAVSVNSTTANFACTGTDTTLTDGEKDTFNCAGLSLPSGKFKATLNIAYTNAQTTMTHTKQGELILKIP